MDFKSDPGGTASSDDDERDDTIRHRAAVNGFRSLPEMPPRHALNAAGFAIDSLAVEEVPCRFSPWKVAEVTFWIFRPQTVAGAASDEPMGFNARCVPNERDCGEGRLVACTDARRVAARLGSG